MNWFVLSLACAFFMSTAETLSKLLMRKNDEWTVGTALVVLALPFIFPLLIGRDSLPFSTDLIILLIFQIHGGPVPPHGGNCRVAHESSQGESQLERSQYDMGRPRRAGNRPEHDSAFSRHSARPGFVYDFREAHQFDLQRYIRRHRLQGRAHKRQTAWHECHVIGSSYSLPCHIGALQASRPFRTGIEISSAF